MDFPAIPEGLPEEQVGSAELRLRYEDVTQDGRLSLLALPPALGAAVWTKILSSHLPRALRDQGILPLLTRVVVQGGRGPIPVHRPLDARGFYDLAHTADEAGNVTRLVLRTWAVLTGKTGRTHFPGSGGETVEVGRVYAEDVFTRPFAPAAERKVLRFDAPGIPPVPAQRIPLRTVDDLLALPPDATALDPDLVEDPATICFGLAHTDSNQHVNSLVYPRLFEEAALRRLAAHGIGTAVLSRAGEVVYRKPSFAGDRMRIAARAYRRGSELGVVGVFGPVDRPHCALHLVFGS